MRSFVYTIIGISLLTGTALADSKKEANLKAVFKTMDTDENGKATREEFMGFWGQRFKQLDKNEDQVLDNVEWSHAAFTSTDADKNGLVDLPEFDALHAKHFKVLDKNKDELITLQELLRN